MINPKSIFAVVFTAILIGVLYVFFENNFMSGANPTKTTASSTQESGKTNPVELTTQSSVISLPTPAPTLTPIDASSDLTAETESLEMRDYSPLFEELKKTVSE